MANALPPIPSQTPVTGPQGIVTPPWFAFFRQVLSGVTGPAGPQGATGTPGLNGVRGSLWYEGAGAPGTISGQLSGDWYLNTTTGDVWELISGTWTNEGNIRGPQGVAGPTGGANIDGGQANSVYGGGTSVNGGTA